MCHLQASQCSLMCAMLCRVRLVWAQRIPDASAVKKALVPRSTGAFCNLENNDLMRNQMDDNR